MQCRSGPRGGDGGMSIGKEGGEECSAGLRSQGR